MNDAELFLLYINDNYNKLKNKYWKFCQEKQYDFDEDIFSDTIIKCYDCIKKKGELKDKSSYGIESYFFKAFKNNIMNEKRYSRNKKRDRNINSDTINDLYETFYNKTNDPAINKVMTDLRKDFYILWLMTLVENNFDKESFYLFKLKTLVPNMTFKRLAETTKIKASRRKVIEVMHWIRDNITKADAERAFREFYDEFVYE